MLKNEIPTYLPDDFKSMRKAGALAAKILDKLKDLIKPGISTLEINDFCHNMIIENNAIPAPLNYKGFPKSICTSVNHVVCHGIPSQHKFLQEGDIVNIDVESQQAVTQDELWFWSDVLVWDKLKKYQDELSQAKGIQTKKTLF